MPVGTDVQHSESFSAVLDSVEGDAISIRIPHTDYQLDLTLGAESGPVTVAPGKRIQGVIHAQCLRIHPAKAGGKFIEPVWGHPRVVAGRVIGADLEHRRVLVDASVPMWVTAPQGQHFEDLNNGEMVNFYLESGAEFRPGA